MDIKITGGENAKIIADGLKNEVDQYRKGVKLMMWRALSILEASIMQNLRTKLHVQTGRLMNSIPGSKSVNESGGQIVGTIGPEGVKYAAIHEFGGIIKPTKKRFLAIPLDAVLGPDKVARANPLDFKGKSFFLRSKKGNLILAMLEGKEITPLFLMKSQVTMPARPYLYPALEKNKERIAEKFSLFLSSSFKFGGGGTE